MLDILFELTGLTKFTQLHTFVILAITSTKIIAYAKSFILNSNKEVLTALLLVVFIDL